MVAHPGAVAVGDADEPRRQLRPAAHDLPIEMRAFDGRHREITQDEIEYGPLLNKHKCCSAVGYALHLVAVGRQDIGDESIGPCISMVADWTRAAQPPWRPDVHTAR